MTTFMHSGDGHIDNSTHGTLNPATGLNTAWESHYRVIRFLVDQAVARQVDFFVDSGDDFDNGHPSMEALLLFVDAYAPLAPAGIPIIFLDGNHHRTGVKASHRSSIHVVAEMLRAQGAVVFIADRPHLIVLPDGQQVAALPWLSKNTVLGQLGATDLSPTAGDARVSQYAMDLLDGMANEADSSMPLIMASHVTVDDLRIDAVSAGFSRGSEVELAHLFSEPVLPRKGLELLPFSYGALSHIHTPQQLGERYFYAGSPDKFTFTDLPDIKGGNLVTLAADGTMTMERVLTPARALARIDLEADDLRAQMDALAEGTLVQLVLETGHTEIPRTIRSAVYNAGAIIADTKTRPLPQEPRENVTLPKHVDPLTALRTWAEHNPTTGVTPDALVSAAEKLEA